MEVDDNAFDDEMIRLWCHDGKDEKNDENDNGDGNTNDEHHLRKLLLGGPVVEGAVESLPGSHPHPVV